MTMPAMPMPGAQQQQGGWQQLPGGYQPGGQPQPAQRFQPVPQGAQPQFPQAPLPQQMQQPQFQPPVPMPQMHETGSWSQQTAMQMAQPPAPQPQPQPGQFPQPQFPQQPQPQFPQQPQPGQPQPQPQQPTGTIDVNTRLFGPNIPAEMQGRTLGEMTAVYQGMRQVALQHISQQPGGQQPQPTPPAPGQPQQQPTLPQSQTAGWDWRNPQAAIRSAVQEVLQTELAPIRAATTQSQIAQSEAQVAAEIGPQVYEQLRPTLYRQLQGAPADALANPNTWRVAANALVGALAIQASRMQVPGQQPQVPGTFAPQQIGPQAQPIPNIGSFFTEQPGQGGVGVLQQTQATPADRYWADQLMGGNVDLYMAWKTGTPARNSQPPQMQAQQWSVR